MAGGLVVEFQLRLKTKDLSKSVSLLVSDQKNPSNGCVGLVELLKSKQQKKTKRDKI